MVNQISPPAPRTWSPGDLVTAPRLRADAGNAAALLLQRPMVIAQSSAGLPVTASQDVTVAWNTVLADSWGGFTNPATNVYRSQIDGWYLCDLRVPFAYSGGNAAFAAGFSDSSAFAGAIQYGARALAAGAVTARCTDLLPMPAGTVTAMLARQESGAAVSLSDATANLPTVSVRWACALSGTIGLPVPPLTPAPSPVTSAWLNANVRDAVSFLSCPPVMRAHTTSGSVANSSLASPATVSPGSADIDTYGGYGGYGSGTYTVPVSGRYLVAASVNFAATAVSAMQACGIRVNGGTPYWGAIVRCGSSLATGASVVKRLRLTAGQAVQMTAAQSTGSALALNSAATAPTKLVIAWEGI